MPGGMRTEIAIFKVCPAGRIRWLYSLEVGIFRLSAITLGFNRNLAVDERKIIGCIFP
jgi:hypothetical protein